MPSKSNDHTSSRCMSLSGRRLVLIHLAMWSEKCRPTRYDCEGIEPSPGSFKLRGHQSGQKMSECAVTLATFNGQDIETFSHVPVLR